MDSLVDSVPPFLQLAGLLALSLFVASSVAARLKPALGAKVFDRERQSSSQLHFLDYTVVPGVFLVGALWTVISNWDASRPWLGTWSGPRAVAVTVLITYAFGAVIGADALRRKALSTGEERLPWTPFLLMLSGLAALAGCFFADRLG